MKNTYTKPGFSLAPIALEANVSGSCSEDFKNLAEFFGWDLSDPNLFANATDCVTSADLEGYCKFASMNFAGNKPIFGS